METAKRHLNTQIFKARPDETVSAVFAGLRERPLEVLDAVYVVDSDGKLLGLVPWSSLCAARDEATLESLVLRSPPTVGPDADQEHVAREALRSHLTSVPVVDALGRLLGVVPALALIQILHREHVEDLHRIAGILREQPNGKPAIDAPPTRRARDRLPWLLVGLLGAMLTAYLSSSFERTLQRHVTVAFFVPALVYLADAIGTQTEAIVIRALSLSHQPFKQMLRAEVGTGILIGGALGLLSLGSAFLFFGDLRLALSVGVSVLAAGSVATGIGMMLPYALHKAGRDPALGSGPLATIAQDLVTLLIYLTVATALLEP